MQAVTQPQQEQAASATQALCMSHEQKYMYFKWLGGDLISYHVHVTLLFPIGIPHSVLPSMLHSLPPNQAVSGSLCLFLVIRNMNAYCV